MAPIQNAVNLEGFDEILLSTLPPGLSRWRRIDLLSKVRGLGLPLTVVTAPATRRPVAGRHRRRA